MCAHVSVKQEVRAFATLRVFEGGPMTSLKMMRNYGKRSCKDNSPIMRNMTKCVSSKVTEELYALENS